MDSNGIVLYIIGYVLAFIIGVFITRAVFSIPKFLKLQSAQLEVLVEIAKQQGVKPDVIRVIHSTNGIQPRSQSNEEIRNELENSRMTDLEKEALSHPKEK